MATKTSKTEERISEKQFKLANVDWDQLRENFSRHGTERQRQYLVWIAKSDKAPFKVKMWALEQAWRLKMPVPEARLKQSLGQRQYCRDLLEKCAGFPAGSPEWLLWLACIQLCFKGAKGVRDVIGLYREMHRGLRELVPASSKRYRAGLRKGMDKISDRVRAKVLGNEVLVNKLVQAAGPVWAFIVLHEGRDAPASLSSLPDEPLKQIFMLTAQGCPLREAVFEELLKRSDATGRLIDMLFETPDVGDYRRRIKQRLVETSDLADWLVYLGKEQAEPQKWEVVMEVVMAQMDREAEHTPADLLSMRDMAKKSAPKGARLGSMLKKIDKRICKLARSCV